MSAAKHVFSMLLKSWPEGKRKREYQRLWNHHEQKGDLDAILGQAMQGAAYTKTGPLRNSRLICRRKLHWRS